MTRPIVAIIGAIETAQASAEVPHSITEAIALFGGGARGKSAIAQELSGTSDKKDKAYKAALRNVERYYKAERGEGGQGRKPSKATLAKLARINESQAKAGVKAQMRAQGASVKASGTVRVSENERERGNIPELFISPDAMGKILDAYEAHQLVTMEDEFNEGFFDAYDLPAGRFTDIDDIDMTAGATAGAVVFGRASHNAS